MNRNVGGRRQHNETIAAYDVRVTDRHRTFLEQAGIPSRCLTDGEWTRFYLTRKRFNKLLNIFTGKTIEDVHHMLAVGIRNKKLTAVHSLNMGTFVGFVEWLRSCEGQKALCKRTHKARVAVATEAEDALCRLFDVRYKEYVQEKKEEERKHNERIRALKLLMEEEEKRHKQEMQALIDRLQPASGYQPLPNRELNIRCWERYKALHSEIVGNVKYPSEAQLMAAVVECRQEVVTRHRLDYLDNEDKREQLNSYVRGKNQ